MYVTLLKMFKGEESWIMLTQCHGLFCFSSWGCTRSWEGTQGCHCSGTVSWWWENERCIAAFGYSFPFKILFPSPPFHIKLIYLFIYFPPKFSPSFQWWEGWGNSCVLCWAACWVEPHHQTLLDGQTFESFRLNLLWAQVISEVKTVI